MTLKCHPTRESLHAGLSHGATIDIELNRVEELCVHYKSLLQWEPFYGAPLSKDQVPVTTDIRENAIYKK